MSVDEKQIALETPAEVAPRNGARTAWTLVFALPVVGYWGYLLASDRMEMSTFARFASRLAVGGALTLFVLVWWWFNRRISLRDRMFGFAAVVLGGVIAVPLCHHSTGVAGAGMLAGPLAVVMTAWLLWALVARHASPVVQRMGLVVTISCAWAFLTLLRMDGLSGDLRPQFHWRWSPSAEEAFLAEWKQDVAQPDALSLDPEKHSVSPSPGDWTGFRGPNRDSIVRETSIRTHWKAHPPEQIWHRRVGPAWSSLVVVASRVFTQEQRDDMETAVCYDAESGKEIWSYGDRVRFSEETAGPGPRATPCFGDGKLYTVGCTGILNCLDATTGDKLWSHNLTVESGAEVPHWGFTGSPLVVGDLVIAFAGGTGSKNLLAYDAKSGSLAWSAAAGETSYASPQLATVAGKPQILMLTNHGLTAVDPKNGTFLWEYSIPLPPSAPRSIQPQALGAAGVLVASEGDLGLALLDIQQVGDSWTPVHRWKSLALKPAFNDFVVSQGHAFGFDGRIFACVELNSGSRRWKEGRFGEGQVLLLADQSLLLVLSESGEAILLRANPERQEELGRFQAIQGKTWSHPTIVNGRLFVRNAEEMACYELRPANKD